MTCVSCDDIFGTIKNILGNTNTIKTNGELEKLKEYLKGKEDLIVANYHPPKVENDYNTLSNFIVWCRVCGATKIYKERLGL